MTTGDKLVRFLFVPIHFFRLPGIKIADWTITSCSNNRNMSVLEIIVIMTMTMRMAMAMLEDEAALQKTTLLSLSKSYVVVVFCYFGKSNFAIRRCFCRQKMCRNERTVCFSNFWLRFPTFHLLFEIPPPNLFWQKYPKFDNCRDRLDCYLVFTLQHWYRQWPNGSDHNISVHFQSTFHKKSTKFISNLKC